MFIEKNINLVLKLLFATQMTMFILCSFLCRSEKNMFAKVDYRFGKPSYSRLYFSINFAMFIEKNINLVLKLLFATQMTMFILYSFSRKSENMFAKADDYYFGKSSYWRLYLSEINILLCLLKKTLIWS